MLKALMLVFDQSRLDKKIISPIFVLKNKPVFFGCFSEKSLKWVKIKIYHFLCSFFQLFYRRRKL